MFHLQRSHVLASICLVLVACLGHPLFADEERPNILLCIADDWGWPHAGAYGDPVIETPAFDRVASEGVLFEHAFVSSPSCTPSRNAILTGQYHWRLDQGANLWSSLSPRFPVYPLLLKDAGYHVGHWRKSWGPGRLEDGGYVGTHPVGDVYKKGLEEFLEARPEGAPFCFWLGAYDPHRGYKLGSGRASGIDVDKVVPPGFYPNEELIRSDIADYYYEVQRFDSDVAAALALLEARGELENTIVIVTGDHGMPFPRCKSNIYEMGVRVPLAMRWGEHIDEPRRIEAFVSLCDLAPTFLQAAGIPIPPQMTGTSLLPLLEAPLDEEVHTARDHVIYGKERHVPCRPDHGGYPCRGIRTSDHAYIRNFEPDRWPVGDPPIYGDTDPAGGVGEGITKTFLLEHRDAPAYARYYEWSFAKRPAEELYDMRADPDQLVNLADDPRYSATKQRLSELLMDELRVSRDPRVVGGAEKFDLYPYHGGGVWKQPAP